MDVIYIDNEPRVGINAYFPWGHHFFNNQSQFEAYMAIHYRHDVYQLVLITDENYQELLFKGVFHAI
ncbi:hypothetical protein [Vibrio fluminensis]|uniref:hypothetical protein n=1 Tax=Vibrio fluminensis TaxID=2783614 RepID=UPI001889816E|nr:hypothetical protein [Vibrio fluminensis]